MATMASRCGAAPAAGLQRCQAWTTSSSSRRACKYAWRHTQAGEQATPQAGSDPRTLGLGAPARDGGTSQRRAPAGASGPRAAPVAELGSGLLTRSAARPQLLPGSSSRGARRGVACCCARTRLRAHCCRCAPRTLPTPAGATWCGSKPTLQRTAASPRAATGASATPSRASTWAQPPGARRTAQQLQPSTAAAAPSGAGFALLLCTAAAAHPCSSMPPRAALRAHSTWVTINTETRKLAKLPEDVKRRFLRLAPSPPRSAIPANETRLKLPDFEWPPQVCVRQRRAARVRPGVTPAAVLLSRACFGGHAARAAPGLLTACRFASRRCACCAACGAAAAGPPQRHGPQRSHQ